MRWLSCWQEVFPDEKLTCRDAFYRTHERYLRQMIYQDLLGDDYIIEPWLTVQAVYATPVGSRRWGPEIKVIPSPNSRGAWMFDPPLKDPEDLAKLVVPHHRIDEEETARNVAKLQDAVGDILEVNVDRGPYYRMWSADISTDMAYLRGLEQIMWDMVDRPGWVHELASFLRDGVLTAHGEAEAAGDWSLCNHQNQAMSYAEELQDPRANSGTVQRKDLWVFAAAQEFAQVSPEMFNEFILQYQIPILKKFGLVAYGCCEDLTRKIRYLRQIPNLRRIAVTPWADVAACAEQIGPDYVLSWRPSPAEMVCTSFEPQRIRRVVEGALDACRAYGCHVDITLKDVETVQGDFNRLIRFVQIVRELSESYA